MSGYVYKYTHKTTGKWYIGSHSGNNPNYQGSGILWSRAKEKYGIDSFEKEILYEGEMFREVEEDILKTLDAANNEMSYNMKNEALGGAFFGEKNGMFGKTLCEESRYKCGNAMRGKKRPEHSEKMKGKNNPTYGKNEHTFGLLEYSKSRAGSNNIDFFGKEKALEISKKLSKAQTGKPKPGTSKAMTGGGNSSAKPILFRGEYYSCIKDAMEKTGLSRYNIKKECEYL